MITVFLMGFCRQGDRKPLRLDSGLKNEVLHLIGGVPDSMKVPFSLGPLITKHRIIGKRNRAHFSCYIHACRP
jgi:hypothetical protein